MSLNNIIKRASSFLGISPNNQAQLQYEDGDIVYSKNNVCVHTPSQYRGEGSNVHHPGYMVVKCLSVTTDQKTLTLSWIPNERLKRNHDLIYYGKSEENLSIPANYSIDADTISISSNTIPELRLEEREENEEPIGEKKAGELPSPSAKHDSCSGEFGTSSTSSSSLTATITSEESNVEGDSNGKSSSVSDSTSGVYSSEDLNDSKELLKQDVTSHTQNREERIQNTEEGIQNREERIQNTEEGIQNTEEGIQNTEEGIQNTEEGIQNTEEGIQNTEEGIQNTEEGIQNTEEETLNTEGKELDQESKTRYVSSSSDSSCDTNNKKSLEASVVAETSESSYQLETNNTEDELSVGSSTDLQLSPPPRYFSARARDQWYDRTAESMAYCANLAFPESPSNVSSLSPTPVEGGSSPVRRQHKCGIFSIDIGLMKSLRLFFSDKEKTCGQLVVASEESQYKILHFHHGGLDKLASVFEDWNFLVGPTTDNRPKEMDSPTDVALKQFSVCRPRIQDCELHPEEGSQEYLDAESWVTYFSEDGLIEDELSLRRTIFFGGVEPQLRTNVWPFLLHYYDFRTTFNERQILMEEKHALYSKINSARESLRGEEKDLFWKEVQCTVEKDVVRTDRSKRCFQGNNNPNLEKMKNILLNFAYYNPQIGYTQGMSDIVAPILAEVRNESDVFWCFTGMMSKTIFVTSPRDQDMERNLRYLCELMRLMVPSFYDYVCLQEDGKDLLFCHRWILLCFKREFFEDEVLAMWEACWSNYQTDYFHLFLVVSIIAVYGTEVSNQQMKPDEMLLYFTSLANHMDGNLVLKKARGLLHQFRSRDRIPCTLVGLCELCGPGMWDSGHTPTVECVGHSDGSPVPCLVAQSAILTTSKLDEASM